MMKDEKEKLIKELYKYWKSYKYWQKRSRSFDYNTYPNFIYIDSKESEAFYQVEQIIDKLNIDFYKFIDTQEIIYLNRL